MPPWRLKTSVLCNDTHQLHNDLWMPITFDFYSWTLSPPCRPRPCPATPSSIQNTLVRHMGWLARPCFVMLSIQSCNAPANLPCQLVCTMPNSCVCDKAILCNKPAHQQTMLSFYCKLWKSVCLLTCTLTGSAAKQSYQLAYWACKKHSSSYKPTLHQHTTKHRRYQNMDNARNGNQQTRNSTHDHVLANWCGTPENNFAVRACTVRA